MSAHVGVMMCSHILNGSPFHGVLKQFGNSIQALYRFQVMQGTYCVILLGKQNLHIEEIIIVSVTI